MSAERGGAELGKGEADERTVSYSRQCVSVLLLCAVVFWVRLGADGLSATEGSRAIPGWEMLASGDWVVPTLFEQPYLRKPPGMAWAVAGSSMLFGQTEFAARAVSAVASTLMALLAFVFARRWFGPRYAAAAGFAFALTPWFWQAGRSAEIEALNNLFIQATVFLIVDRLVFATRNVKFDVIAGGAAGLALGGALLTKGPVGVVIVLAVAVGCCVVLRSLGPMARPTVWIALVASVVCFGVWFFLAASHVKSTQLDPVTQSIGMFLWDPAHMASILTLAPVAFVSALPMSVSLVFGFGTRASRPLCAGDDPGDRGLLVVRSLACGCVLSLVALTLLGVSNTRYAMPAVVFVAPCVVFALRGWAGHFAPGRRAMAHVLLLGHPKVSMGVMLVALGMWIFAIEPRRDVRSGRDAGEALAAFMPDGSVVLSDHLIEARPEVLWYAKRAAMRDGKSITTRWVPGLSLGDAEFDENALYLLRTDEVEAERMEEQGLLQELRVLTVDKVHTYTFTLYGR